MPRRSRPHREGQIATPRPAIGYVRVSTEEQAVGGVSLDAQRERVREYCRLHELTLERIHADEGISGKRADNRPGLQEAVESACRSRAPLVVYSLSRLARSTRDAIEIVDRLAKAGADLVSISERIDTTSPMGRFFFTTMAALAQLERDLISERTKAAMAHKRRRGQRVSGIVPLGYDLAEDGVHLVENGAEQRVLRRIRELHGEGLGSRRIIRQLEREGIRPKHGGRWHPKVVIEICGRGVRAPGA